LSRAKPQKFKQLSELTAASICVEATEMRGKQVDFLVEKGTNSVADESMTILA
jgi:hypothetical protein